MSVQHVTEYRLIFFFGILFSRSLMHQTLAEVISDPTSSQCFFERNESATVALKRQTYIILSVLLCLSFFTCVTVCVEM